MGYTKNRARGQSRGHVTSPSMSFFKETINNKRFVSNTDCLILSIRCVYMSQYVHSKLYLKQIHMGKNIRKICTVLYKHIFLLV